MAKIPLTGGFTLIPEGKTIFKIVDVEYKEDFGKLSIKMETAEGLKHTERFSLLTDSGEPNEKAYNAFSYFAKTALNQYDIDEIDHSDLIGHYIEANVNHNQVPSTKKEGEMYTCINLGDKAPATGFDEEAPTQKKAASAASEAPRAKGKVDLDKLLG